ncbi:hypothetical protein K8R43_04215 [archaeon]|nr:hypothetical protein [archaeon]
MVSVYVKGLILGCLLMTSSMAVLWMLDQQRITILNNDLRELAWQSDDSRLFIDYAEEVGQVNSTLKCKLIEKRVGQQVRIIEGLGEKIEAYRNANVFNSEYFSLKKNFLYRAIEVHLNLIKYKRECNGSVNHVVYYYVEYDQDQTQCPDCSLQEAALNILGKDCPNTWVFAYPVNTDIDLINLMKEEHDITNAPATVINGEHIHKGFADLETLKSKLECGENLFEPEENTTEEVN